MSLNKKQRVESRVMFLSIIKHYLFYFELLFSKKPKRIALRASPDARKLHTKYINLSQGNLIRSREKSGNLFRSNCGHPAQIDATSHFMPPNWNAVIEVGSIMKQPTA